MLCYHLLNEQRSIALGILTVCGMLNHSLFAQDRVTGWIYLTVTFIPQDCLEARDTLFPEAELSLESRA
jgi:hypothetical protein